MLIFYGLLTLGSNMCYYRQRLNSTTGGGGGRDGEAAHPPPRQRLCSLSFPNSSTIRAFYTMYYVWTQVITATYSHNILYHISQGFFLRQYAIIFYARKSSSFLSNARVARLGEKNGGRDEAIFSSVKLTNFRLGTNYFIYFSST